MTRTARLAAALAVALAAGCASSAVTLDLGEVSVQAAPDANDGSAVAVDVVLATRPGLVEQVAKLTATEWFRRRTQILRDNPDGLRVLSWELVPGQSASRAVTGQVLDGYVFAAYGSAGDHRARLTVAGGQARILLQATDFVVEPPRKEGT